MQMVSILCSHKLLSAGPHRLRNWGRTYKCSKLPSSCPRRWRDSATEWHAWWAQSPLCPCLWWSSPGSNKTKKENGRSCDEKRVVGLTTNRSNWSGGWGAARERGYVVAAEDLPVPDELLRCLPSHLPRSGEGGGGRRGGEGWLAWREERVVSWRHLGAGRPECKWADGEGLAW